MTFKTAFDAASAGYSTWWFPASGLIFVAIGGLLVFAPGLMQPLMRFGPKGKYRTVFSWFFLVFASLWTVLSFLGTFLQYHMATSCLNAGNCSVVEGPVTDFVPMPYEGHSMESFTVGGRRFSYSDYEVSAGFNNTASHGGPIRAGLHVRVTYWGNLILRLEVAR